MTSPDFTDLETQQQSRPREESFEPFTADESMRVDPVVPDRGLKCCCEVDVRFLLCFRPGLTGPLERRYRFLLVRSLWALVSHVVGISNVSLSCRPCPYSILLGVWGPWSSFLLSTRHKHYSHRYHGARDKRIPNSYQCFNCRIHSDKNWDLIVMRDQHLVLFSDFKDLAIFRYGVDCWSWTSG